MGGDFGIPNLVTTEMPILDILKDSGLGCVLPRPIARIQL